MFRKIILFCLLLFAAMVTHAQQTTTVFWSDISERGMTQTGQRRIIPQKGRAFSINIPVLSQVLGALNDQNGATADIALPLPNGNSGRFRIAESSAMAPALQAKYPAIRCYTGYGLDDPTALLKCDLTPWGFHAMIQSVSMGTIYMDPYFHGETSVGIAYFKKDYQSKAKLADGFACAPPAIADQEIAHTANDAESIVQGDCQKRLYRLALSCSGEYATFHGGTKPLVLAAMNTSMNRVNGVYEREFAITMQIIANNDTLIFLNSATDPFTNDDGGAMLGENQTTVTARIGAANYDIGHVFSTGGGGVAGLGIVCRNNSKAQGVTGGGSPIGDPFDIDYVAHEIGHQFGGNHCFNNSCGGNINQPTAMEPGSGATIMAYAGICPPDVQNNSDDYFHAINIQEIMAYVTTGSGNNCPVKTVTGNNSPTVSAGADYIIPRSTPFALTAAGTDPDASNALTYCWEQMDNQTATMPPVATNAVGPMFRSFDPVGSPVRTFPRLNDLISNTTPTWEKLPSVGRTMKFRVTVRDNFAGAGCTEEDDMVVTVNAASGPFAVTVPNTNVLWQVGEQQLVTWNVNGTDIAPVSCSTVRILLSTDGGFTYPVVLAGNVGNTGTAMITVPNNVSSTCRVRVEAIGNIFFDISNQNFRIETPLTPTFVLSSTTSSLQACAGQITTFSVSSSSVLGFSNPINLTVSGAPAGATVAIASNPLTPGSSSTISISGLTNAMAGTYSLNVAGTAGTITQNATTILTVVPGTPEVPALVTPANATMGVSTTAILTWNAVSFAMLYDIQVAKNPDFAAGNIVVNETTANSTITTTNLLAATPYYWRVRAKNDCGISDWTTVYAFQTGTEACNQQFASTNVPVAIDVNGVVNVFSVLNVPTAQSIIDVNLIATINHTYLGDIDASLVGPLGQTVQLFDRPGDPAIGLGCSGDDLVVTFDDEATQTAAALEGTCEGTTPAIEGTFQAINALSVFDGQSAQGTWKLLVNDSYAGEDEGTITAWSLSFCFAVSIGNTGLLANLPLLVNTGATKNIDPAHLSATASGLPEQVQFTLLALPVHGTLALNGVTLGIGSTFTQADIAANLVTFTHNGDQATSDAFLFDVFDTNNNGWLYGSTFQIIIQQNTLTATGSITQPIACNNGANGAITLVATGGAAPLSYTLNSGASQTSGVFNNLSAGTYTGVVTDAAGFSSTVSVLILTNPSVITVSTGVVFDDLTVTASGGTGALQYSINGTDFQPTGVFENLTDGIYTVTVSDANGCSATTQTIVSVSTLLANATVTTAVSCFEGNNGLISVQVAGGFVPYEYSLNGGTYQAENTFSGLSAGTYSIAVRDANGTITTTASVVIAQPAQLTVAASANQNTITGIANGGTGALLFSLNGGTPQASNTFIVLANGDYTLLVTDENGCSQSSVATVNQDPLVLTVAPATANCAGIYPQVSLSATGGFPPYQYSYDAEPFQAGNVFFNLTGEPHTFIVRDAASNQEQQTVNYPAPNPLVASATVVLNTITVSASGSATPYTYNLVGGSTQASNEFTGLSNGVYTIVITSLSTGCTTTVTAVVNVPPLTLNISVAGLCAGSAYTVTAEAQGGIPPYQYSLNGSPFQSSNVFELTVFTPNMTVVVQDAAGASVTQTVVIAQPVPITATSTVTGNDVVLLVTGGTAPYTFSPSNLLDLQNGSYTVTITDANGCTGTVAFTINYTQPQLSVTSMSPLCAGQSNGTITAAVANGIAPYQYSLNGGSFGSNNTFQNLAAGTYTVVVRDGAGTTASVQVNLPAPPTLNATAMVSGNILTVTASGGTSPYVYSLDNGVNTQASPVFDITTSGTYTAWVADANGCIKTVQGLVVVETIEPTVVWGLSVAPNPTTGLVQLQLNAAPTGILLSEIYDMQGRLLQSEIFEVTGSAFATTLDLGNLPQGMYILRLQNGLQTGAVRITKE